MGWDDMLLDALADTNDPPWLTNADTRLLHNE
jgi:hypothetical protein